MTDPRIDDLYTAIGYAPLGVRDAASRSLQDLLGSILSPTLDAMDQVRAKHAGLPDFTPRLLRAEAELKKLRHSYAEALRDMRIVAGEAHLPVGYNSLQDVAREWLGRHRPLVSAHLPESNPST